MRAGTRACSPSPTARSACAAAWRKTDSPSQGTLLSAVWERTPIEYHERFPGFARHTDTRIPVADATHIGIRLGDTPVRLDQGEMARVRACAGPARRLPAGVNCAGARPQGATLEIEAERIVQS